MKTCAGEKRNIDQQRLLRSVRKFRSDLFSSCEGDIYGQVGNPVLNSHFSLDSLLYLWFLATSRQGIGQLQGRIQAIQNAHQRELMKLEAKHRSDLEHKDTAYMGTIERLKNRVSWQNLIIGSLSFLLLKTSDIFRKAVNGIIHLARDYYKPRFDVEQVSDIKSALNLFGDDRQSHRAAGDFLYITATQKGKLDNREQIKARREVDNVVEGNYDQQKKRGFSIRR